MNFFSKKGKRIYLDHAGATPISKKSESAFIEALKVYGNPSGIHQEGSQASKLLDTARSMLATELNVHSYEVYLMSSGTESCNLAVLGTYEGYHKDNKDEVPHMIVSSIEHPAILEPVKFLEREKKIVVTYLPVNEEGFVRVEDVRTALNDETILVSVMYANNEIGTIQPVKEIGRAIDEWKREKGLPHTAYPYFHTDACQAANYCNIDALRLKCHLMTVNSGKVYGPKGAALLYKREGVKISQTTYGGGQERELRSGTEAVPAYVAFAHALKETGEIKNTETRRLEEFSDYAKAQLKEKVPSIVFYGGFDEVGKHIEGHDAPKRVSRRLPNNLNCRVPGISSEEMILRLDAKGFAVSHKSACASLETDGSYVLMALGASEHDARENVRISFGRTTTKKDVDELVGTISEIAKKYTNA